jgi:hypothetical protein
MEGAEFTNYHYERASIDTTGLSLLSLDGDGSDEPTRLQPSKNVV